MDKEAYELTEDEEYFDIRPPEYQCDGCSAIFVPLKAYYPCPKCHKPSGVRRLMSKVRTDENASLAEIIKNMEDEENRIYTSDSEFPNFVLEQVGRLKYAKKHFGRFFQTLRCGTGLALSVRDLRYGGYFPQFVGFNLQWFYDFFEYNKYKDINKAIEDYFKDQDYEEFEYLKGNIKDAILEVYQYYKKDRSFRRKRIFKLMLDRLQQRIVKEVRRHVRP